MNRSSQHLQIPNLSQSFRKTMSPTKIQSMLEDNENDSNLNEVIEKFAKLVYLLDHLNVYNVVEVPAQDQPASPIRVSKLRRSQSK